MDLACLVFRRPDFDKDYKSYKDHVANQELLLENFMINVCLKHYKQEMSGLSDNLLYKLCRL